MCKNFSYGPGMALLVVLLLFALIPESEEAMKQRISELRRNIEQTEHELKEMKAELEKVERECLHQWGDSKQDDIIRPAGSSQGDPEGTMGVDRQLPFSWPEERTPRWKRVCERCGKIQFTKNSKPTGAVNPVF